ncbi:ABC transporter permease [Phenylobacterium sp.]|uniref:ABC transporter permease n=1 Tax=Phenylobacterium sp. TaxID=1871053 RepID=UPI0025FCA710|nr:ABC transporter permease [Phenylobacterium sp.]
MRADGRPSGLVLRWMIAGEWRARPGRVVLAILAIAVGVALGFAVHLVNRSALDEFGRALQAVNGDADLQVHSVSAAGFAEGLYPILARLDGVAVASPVVELDARGADGAARDITLLGVDILRAAQATPSLIASPVSGAAFGSQASPFDADTISLSRAALAALGRRAGESVTLTAAGRTATFRIAGPLAGAGEGQGLGVVDIAAAQWRFGQLGRLQRIDLKLAPAANREAVEAAVSWVLPADAELVTAHNAAQRSDSLSRAYRVNLEMLSMVALLTGGFLVYSAQSLSVTLRRPQFALVRVLGVARRGLLTQLFIEGATVGVGGAALGIALGFGLAGLALRLLGGDLGGGVFAGSHPHLAFAPIAAAVFMGLGVAVALAGSLLPALEAGRAQPAIALKTAGDVIDPERRPSPALGAGLLGAGAAAALAPPILGLPLAGYAAMALMLAGGVAATPWLARRLLAPLRHLSRPAPPLALAIARLWGAPGQAAVALCGIVASVSLMVAMATMVSSFRGSVESWLTQILPSDVYLRLDSADAGLDRAAQRALAAAPGVAHISFRRTTLLRLRADRPPVALTATAIDAAHPERTLPILGRTRAAPAGAVPVWLSEPMARLYDRRVGDTFPLALGGVARPVFVAGIWRDYARQFGAIAITDTDYTRLTGDAGRGEAAIDLKPGAAPAAVMRALRETLPPGLATEVSFAQPRQIRAIALRLFDRSFAATYALEAIAIGIGLSGVAATFSAQTLARAKEFGMLRHIGVRRGQLLTMLAIEGALLGAVGVAAGLSLGVTMSQVLIHVINPQSFNWTMETRLPWLLLGSLAMALIAAAAGTAVLSGRSATAASAVNAVREDW